MSQQMAEAALEKLLRKGPGRIPPHHFKTRIANGVSQPPPVTEGSLPWVTQNTAILIVHGIGNQLPMETLDMFGRGLVSEYAREYEKQITIQHCVVAKEQHTTDLWFDNVVRIKKKGSEFHIDLFEYYWANYTEDKASWTDISLWLDGVVKGAKEFYNEQPTLGKNFNDTSIFFDKNGNFNPLVYKLFIGGASKFIVSWNLAQEAILKLLCYVPLVGGLASTLLRALLNKSGHQFANIMGDICVYNVADPKSKFYSVRRQILDGAVKAIKFLLEERKGDGARTYPSVIVAGHSLGSQISYDAINKINLLVNQGMIGGYDNKGECTSLKDPSISKISDQLNGYITFGSPLDKIVFFLREKTARDQKLRQQLLEAYHCFKQLQWSSDNVDEPYLKLEQCIVRFLDDIPWRNYYDDKDYVSGRLDYYGNVDNVNCHFNARGWFAFTHSNYWGDSLMYRDIITNILSKARQEVGVS